jgi:hypothetical protein
MQDIQVFEWVMPIKNLERQGSPTVLKKWLHYFTYAPAACLSTIY